MLQRWYRERLRELVPPLSAGWEARLAVEVAEWRIKKMKTRWDSCNPRTRRIWINLELAKKSPGGVSTIWCSTRWRTCGSPITATASGH